MAARFTWQVLGVLFIVCGLFGKVGAVLSIIPEPVIGAVIVVGLGMVITVALSNIHLIDLRMPRNLMILGISLMLGMMLPTWVREHRDSINTGNITILKNIVRLNVVALLTLSLTKSRLYQVLCGGLHSYGVNRSVLDAHGVTYSSQFNLKRYL